MCCIIGREGALKLAVGLSMCRLPDDAAWLRWTGPYRHARKGPDTILPSSHPCYLHMLRPYKTLHSPLASTAI